LGYLFTPTQKAIQYFYQTWRNQTDRSDVKGGQTMIEKVFAIQDHHVNGSDLILYHTLDRRVVHLVFLKPVDWPNRAKEEVFKCLKCKSFVLPREKVIHKANCKGVKNGILVPVDGRVDIPSP
jgi:hypothetical protein